MNCECPDCEGPLDAKAVCWTYDDGGGNIPIMNIIGAMGYDMSDPDTAQELGWFPTCIVCIQYMTAGAGVSDDAITWEHDGVTYWRKPLYDPNAPPVPAWNPNDYIHAMDSESEEEEESPPEPEATG
jgi:hypothetical protein